MKTWVRKSLSVGVLAAGAVLMSGGAAMADAAPATGDNYGLANGAQVNAPIDVPVNLCGNAVSGVGAVAFAECDGGAAAGESAPDVQTGDNYGALNGLQANAPVTAAIDLCGNSISGALGAAMAGCEGGTGGGTGSGGYGEEAARAGSGRAKARAAGQHMMTSGNYGALNGLQVNAPITVPVSACGLSVAGIGAGSWAGCAGGAAVKESARTEGAHATGDNFGALNGVQLNAPIKAAVDVTGNAISLVGSTAFAGGTGGASTAAGNKGARSARHADESLPVIGSLPVGNLLSGLGGAKHARAGHVEGAGSGTGSNYGLGNGIQANLPVQAAVNASGNAISGIAGAAFASSTGGALTK